MRTGKSFRASSGMVLVCPTCGAGEVEDPAHAPARCAPCGAPVEPWALRTLREIVSLPDATGRHACECGHPEMRLLPDNVYRCPSCGDEVLPLEG